MGTTVWLSEEQALKLAKRVLQIVREEGDTLKTAQNASKCFPNGKVEEIPAKVSQRS